LKGFGPTKFLSLLQQVKSLSHCFNGHIPTQDFIRWCVQHQIVLDLDWKGVEKDLNWAAQPDCHILTWQDDRYPALLKEIHSAAPVLFVQGQPSLLKSPQLAIVGSRYPTPQGLINAGHFARGLVHKGFTITSGLALGIDGASHTGALEAQGKTIAVLGNGLDRVYPPHHRNLAHKIVANGALVSEFPIGTLPHATHFPRRNRIISGLSLGVLVVESALKSGSLITAKYALEHDREVFALPGPIVSPLSRGCHQLIRQGATCVENVDHILEELPQHILPCAPSESDDILSNIVEVCTPIDTIIEKTGLTPQEVSSMLMELELRGKVVSVPGGYIRTPTGG
jgi:DNA processing protein